MFTVTYGQVWFFTIVVLILFGMAIALVKR